MDSSDSPPAATTPALARRVLVLQGGGALGSYQAGAYQALCHHDFEPEWVAGISIGALNSALIAGNSPKKRVEKLREFWEAITTPPFGIPDFKWFDFQGEIAHSWINQARSLARFWAARQIFSNRECRRLTSIRTARSKPSAITMSHR